MPSPLKKLFAPDKTPLFPFIDGLRALSILWVISLHTLWMFGYFLDQQAFIEFSTRAELSPFFQGHLAVDSFFVISGFLIGYYLFHEYQQQQTLKLKQFYMRRALRLLPAYFTVMLIVAVAYPLNLHNQGYDGGSMCLLYSLIEGVLTESFEKANYIVHPI